MSDALTPTQHAQLAKFYDKKGEKAKAKRHAKKALSGALAHSFRLICQGISGPAQASNSKTETGGKGDDS